MNRPKIEKWVINIKKIKEDDFGRNFIDREFNIMQLFNLDLGKPNEEYLDLMLKKFYNDIVERSDFFKE